MAALAALYAMHVALPAEPTHLVPDTSSEVSTMYSQYLGAMSPQESTHDRVGKIDYVLANDAFREASGETLELGDCSWRLLGVVPVNRACSDHRLINATLKF